MYNIRQFKATDMFTVIKLASGTLTEQYSPNIFNYFYETFPQGFIIAEHAQKLIGFIVGVKTTTTNAKILMLAVSPMYKRKKIGSALLTQFLKEISDLNLQNIELEVRTNNKEAIEFYEKHGFKIVDTISKFYQAEEDAYTMRLTI